MIKGTYDCGEDSGDVDDVGVVVYFFDSNCKKKNKRSLLYSYVHNENKKAEKVEYRLLYLSFHSPGTHPLWNMHTCVHIALLPSGQIQATF